MATYNFYVEKYNNFVGIYNFSVDNYNFYVATITFLWQMLGYIIFYNFFVAKFKRNYPTLLHFSQWFWNSHNFVIV